MKARGCLLAAVCALILAGAVGQTTHTVGDSLNWTTRTPNTSYYADWAAGQTFRVGDSLVFNFVENVHDVVEVPQASYTSCSASNNISSIILTSPATFTLSSSGSHYYICTFPGHCQQGGQRLNITVLPSAGASPPIAAPPTGAIPPTAATPPPTSAGAIPPSSSGGAIPPTSSGGASPPTTPSNPSAPGSGAVSLAGSFLFVLLSAGMVFLV